MESAVFVLFLFFVGQIDGFDTGNDRIENAQSSVGNKRPERFLTKAQPVYIYVSPTNGSDTKNDGTRTTHAFQTLPKALSVAETHAGHDVYIELQKGYYDLDNTIYITNRNTSSKLTIRAYRGQEVHVTGGPKLDSSLFKPVTDQRILSRLPAIARSHVRVAKLADLNITNYGKITRYGGGWWRVAPLEVFYNGEPLRLAQWPNKGYINVVAVIKGTKTTTFKYNSQRPRAWKDEHDIWTYGTWRYGWFDRSMKVQSLNAVSQTVVLTETTDITVGQWNDTSNRDVHQQGGYFRFFNVLSELDEPGEYFLDTTNGNLYVWVPNSSGHIDRTDDVHISMLHDCIQIRRRSSNVAFQDITLENCRSIGITAADVTNITLNQMEIRNMGGYAVNIYDKSSGVKITKNMIHDCSGGIHLVGGNRTTLESSGHVVSDNEIYRYTRVGAGFWGLALDGVGTEVRNNHIHESDSGGIQYQGNNFVIEYNRVNHTCQGISSCTALFTTDDWTKRGNVVRYNWIHDTIRKVPGGENKGITLDSQHSSTTMMYNVLYNNDIHVLIGGGRDNILENNILYNATDHAIWVDGRGLHHYRDKWLIENMNKVPYKSSVWTNMYPKMKDFDHQNKSLPEGNQIVRNLFYDEKTVDTIHGLGSDINNASYFNITENGWATGPGDFFDVTNDDFRVVCYSLEWATYYHFKQPITPNLVGPIHFYGPHYKRKRPISHRSKHHTCKALPPQTGPVGSYLPDGSGTSDKLINHTREGCWLDVQKCREDPDFVGTYRDMYGEIFENATANETMCFKRALEQWQYCGSDPKEQVMAIYGPTGASTIMSGEGCLIAQYGCPNHGGPANGTRTPGKFFRDYYGEQSRNATTEAGCLERARSYWNYCGKFPNHPQTAIFRPTGATLTVGPGCWIKIEKCPKRTRQNLYFYDGWGEANLYTDEEQDKCYSRALHWWIYCGSHPEYHVTAEYRPTGTSKTVPPIE